MPGQMISFPKSISLAELNSRVQHQEAAIGPLVSITHDGAKTVGAFEVAVQPPTVPIVIRELIGGVAVIPAGATRVCVGKAYIISQSREVVAFRM